VTVKTFWRARSIRTADIVAVSGAARRGERGPSARAMSSVFPEPPLDQQFDDALLEFPDRQQGADHGG